MYTLTTIQTSFGFRAMLDHDNRKATCGDVIIFDRKTKASADKAARKFAESVGIAVR